MNEMYGSSDRRTLDWASFNWWGLFIVLMGIAWLGDNMNWWTFNWSMIGPIALVFAGAMLFLRRK